MQFDILHATQEELNKVNPDPHTQVLLEILILLDMPMTLGMSPIL